MVIQWQARKLSTGIDTDTIAEAVWDANLTAHTTVGTFGWFVQKLLTTAKFLGI